MGQVENSILGSSQVFVEFKFDSYLYSCSNFAMILMGGYLLANLGGFSSLPNNLLDRLNMMFHRYPNLKRWQGTNALVLVAPRKL